MVILHSDHCDNVHRQFGSCVIHEVRRVVFSSGGRTGLPTKIKYSAKINGSTLSFFEVNDMIRERKKYK